MRTRLMMMIAAGIAGAALPAAAPGQSGRVVSGTDGARLLAFCNSRQAGDQGYCYGYVTGVIDQLAIEGAICVPVQFDQVIAVARSHLAAASSADMKKHATFLLARVLKATYPCRR
jgi:hypothetical protein